MHPSVCAQSQSNLGGRSTSCVNGHTFVFVARNRPLKSYVKFRLHAVPGEIEESPEVGWLWEPSLARTRAVLAGMNARPKKALGQNFISDPNIIKRIASTGSICPDDIVIEVGPGTGNLTQEILRAGATVLAVEKDYAFAESLEHRFQGTKRCKILQGDILRLNMIDLIRTVKCLCDDKDKLGSKRVRIVANLPYYITTDLLKQLLPLGDEIKSLLLLVQDEVAQRLTSEHPGGAAYRPMTVFSHFYAVPEYHFRIDRSCFHPVPSVHGAVVSFNLLRSSERRSVRNEKEFLSFVRHAFLSKRKLLTNSLQPQWDREVVCAALEKLEIEPNVRPSEISSFRYVDVYNTVCEQEALMEAEKVGTQKHMQ